MKDKKHECCKEAVDLLSTCVFDPFTKKLCRGWFIFFDQYHYVAIRFCPFCGIELPPLDDVGTAVSEVVIPSQSGTTLDAFCASLATLEKTIGEERE